MSGRSSNLWPRENRQPGQDYREYVPSNRNHNRSTARLLDYVPISGGRDPWWFVDERLTGGSNYGIASSPSTSIPPAPVQFLLIEAYNSHRRSRNTFPEISPMYYNPFAGTAAAQQESRLSQEDQNKAINKLRKQLYNPHISNIIRRLGTKSTSGNTKNIMQDDIGKRCAVCLEDFVTKQFVTTTPCDHMFHEECIVPWVKSQGKCPVCRLVLS